MDKKSGLLLSGVLGLGGLIGGYAFFRKNKNNQGQMELEEVKSIKEILEAYSKDFNESGAIESVIPRKFEK